jgi:hypothetical protein
MDISLTGVKRREEYQCAWHALNDFIESSDKATGEQRKPLPESTYEFEIEGDDNYPKQEVTVTVRKQRADCYRVTISR